MTVEVRLFATLASYLPPGSKDGLARVEVNDGATVADVASRLGIPAGLDRVLLVNGAEADPGLRLSPGDVIDIFPPLAGGHEPLSASPMAESISAPTRSARLDR